ncbi:MAG: hypothetical protein IPM83_10290 [Ignavibacteria bacterium]|nr:hypothetical protein [Ignavibacteria bacterium]
MRSAFFFFLFIPTILTAQIAATVEVRLSLGDAQTPDGPHAITVQWYDVPSGGTSLAQEDLTVDLSNGEATLILGTTSPLPLNAFDRGAVFLGISVDGSPERSPRTPLLPQAFARASAFAEVAERLSPNVTGIVTSINEVAGNVKLVGGDGVRITRNGSIIMVERDSAIAEQGVITGTGTEYTFRIQPKTTLRSEHDVTFRVSAGTTTIQAGCTIDTTTNTMVFVTSAPLLNTEQILWEIRR